MSTCDRTTLVANLAESVGDYVNAMLAHPGALRGQQVRGGGPAAEFETLLAERTGFPHCLATSSATSALLVAALALDLADKHVGVERGCWEGSLGVLEAAGAELVEVDSLMTASFEGFCAIVATDRRGQRHDASGLRALCNETGTVYIEDTGWLPGVTAPNADMSLADIQVMSFGPGKPVSLGEGGVLLCRDERMYQRAVSLSQHPERCVAEGIARRERPPLNARIHPLAALIGAGLLRNR